MKYSKCTFAQNSVSYLGDVFSNAGVTTDPKKNRAMIDWPVPSCLKELRSFLCLAGYYRNSFKIRYNLSTLDSTTHKGVLFIWTNDHQLAF